MPLRSQLEIVAETVGEFELAAQDKISEGQQLITNSYYSGGIYLLGYAAEMLLKNACIRYIGAVSSDQVRSKLEELLSHSYGLWAPLVRHESKHSLQFWAATLENMRDYNGAGFNPAFLYRFQFAANRLYSNWWVEMRYRQGRANATQALEVLADVGWISSSYTDLYTE